MSSKMRTHKIWLWIFVAVLLIVPAMAIDSNSTSTSEWKMFGRTLNNDRFYPGVSVANISLAKKINFSGGGGTSIPAIVKDYVYYAVGNMLYQLDKYNLTQISNISISVKGVPILVDGVLLVGNGSAVYKLNASNISMIIQYKNIGSETPGVLYNTFFYKGYFYYQAVDTYQLNFSNLDLVAYTAGLNGNGFAADGDYIYQVFSSTGVVLAQYNYTNITYPVNSVQLGPYAVYSCSNNRRSPLIKDGYIFVPTYTGLYKLNASNISLVLQNTSSYATSICGLPVLNNGSLYFHTVYNLYRVNESNISQIFDSVSTGYNQMYDTLALTHDSVYVPAAGGNNQFYQFDASNVSRVISYNFLGDSSSAVTIVDGIIYVPYGNYLYMIYDFLIPSITLISPLNNAELDLFM